MSGSAQSRERGGGGRSSFRAARSLARIAATAALAFPTSAAAQPGGSISGLVLDQANLRPVAGAVVELQDGAWSAVTREDGSFTFDGVPAGPVALRVAREGYVTMVETVEIAPLEESLVHFHLHRVAAMLDQLLVGVDPAERGRGHSESSLGSPGDDMRTAADLLLRSVPGLSVARAEGRAGSGLSIRLRGVSSFVLDERPHIYVDGVRVDTGGEDRAVQVLDQIPAGSVKRIRVLRGPASTSMYPGAAAGVILVETVGPGRSR